MAEGDKEFLFRDLVRYFVLLNVVFGGRGTYDNISVAVDGGKMERRVALVTEVGVCKI